MTAKTSNTIDHLTDLKKKRIKKEEFLHKELLVRYGSVENCRQNQ